MYRLMVVLLSAIAFAVVISCSKDNTENSDNGGNTNSDFSIVGKWEITYNDYMGGGEIEQNSMVGDEWRFSNEVARIYDNGDTVYKFYSNGQEIGEYDFWKEESSWIDGENPYHMRLVAKLVSGSNFNYTPQFWCLRPSGSELVLKDRNGTNHYEAIIVKMKKK